MGGAVGVFILVVESLLMGRLASKVSLRQLDRSNRVKVHQLIEALKRFDPESDVHTAVSSMSGVTQVLTEEMVAEYEGGPLLLPGRMATGSILVGCVVGRPAPPVRKMPIDLGRYADPETAAKVRDFFIYHQKMDEPLSNPGFDYENWIPPRMVTGEYHPRIAAILREKLLRE